MVATQITTFLMNNNDICNVITKKYLKHNDYES